jgi:hypothetical protein
VADPGVTDQSEGTTGAAMAPHSISAAGYDEGKGGAGIHMPSPSWYPALVGLGMTIAAYGAIFRYPGGYLFFAIGGLFTLGGLFGWVLEPSAVEHQDVAHR